jgi:hypothetical protein
MARVASQKPFLRISERGIADLLPEGAEPVKAFGTTSAGSLETAANRKPERAVLFYATDYSEVGNAVAKLITASGLRAGECGGIDESLRIEAFGDLHEYGAPGKLVSAKEAEAVLVRGTDTYLKSA